MVENKFFSSEVALFRALTGFLVQFGIAGDPKVPYLAPYLAPILAPIRHRRRPQGAPPRLKRSVFLCYLLLPLFVPHLMQVQASFDEAHGGRGGLPDDPQVS